MSHQEEFPEGWYRDKDTLVAMLSKYGTPVKLARIAGVAPNTLSKWRSRHGLPRLSPGVPPAVTVEYGDDESEAAVLAALRELGDHATVEEIADKVDIAPRRVREALERAGRDGYRVETAADDVRIARVPTDTGARHAMSASLFDGDLFRFGVVSDTHLGSSAERPESVEAAYDVFAREEIRTVYHCGDLVDGLGVYRNHNTEVRLHTYEDQVAHAEEVYPQRDGVHTFLIGGNHDLEGDFGRAGADPVQAFCNRRPDTTYLGRYSAWVDLPNGATMQLLHPQGGASYATSYRPQKIAESYEAGSKPNILGIGHWHRTGYFMVRGIQTFLAGTHQGPTTFSTRKGMGEAGWGSWLIECRLADDGSVVRFKPEWLPVYPGRN